MIRPAPGPDRTPNREASRGCLEYNAPTSLRKPYCSRHLALDPTAARLAVELASRGAEVLVVARRGADAVDPSGIVAGDVMAALSVGAQSEDRLARDLDIEPAVLRSYLLALERVGWLLRLPLGERGLGRAGAMLIREPGL